MLILTRRVGETLMIGDEVTVTVLGVKGNQVRIGVNAPRDVSVHREEIYERIRRERSATETAPARPAEKLETVAGTSREGRHDDAGQEPVDASAQVATSGAV